MKYLFKFIFLFLRSGVRQRVAFSSATHTQQVMPPEFGGKFGTECLNTRVPSAYSAVCGIQSETDYNLI